MAGMQDLEVPLWLAYWVADLMPFLNEMTGTRPLFTRYSLDAVGSNSLVSHTRASRELGFQPRPARQALVDAVRWFQQWQGGGMPVPEIVPGAGC